MVQTFTCWHRLNADGMFMLLGSTLLKPREARLPVSLSARVRARGAWADARICNVSSRGMLLESPAAFSNGDVIEVRRGPVCVIARVVWAKGGKFGVRSQDRIHCDGLIHAENRQPRIAEDGSLVERRAKARPDAALAHEGSRQEAALIQFLSLAAFGAFGGGAIIWLLWGLLHTTSNTVAAALS
jgi:hypothetical protein